MATGVVKWFNEQKGFGFVIPDEKGEDLFLHYSNIKMDGYKAVKEGQKLTFNVVKGQKGMEAREVIPTNEFVTISKTPTK